MSLPSLPVELELIVEESSSVEEEENSSAEATFRKGRLERHWSMLIVSVLILIAAFALSLSGAKGGQAVVWQGVKLPVFCGSRAWFGVECPGCGLTRSFVALASGDLSQSLHYNRVGWILFTAVMLQIPFRIYSLWEMRTSLVRRRWPTWFGSILIAALIGNWVLNVLWP